MMEFLLIVALALIGFGVWAWFNIRGPKPTPIREALIADVFGHLLESEHETALEELRALYAETRQEVGVGLTLGILLRHMGKHQAAIRTHKSLAADPDLSDAQKAAVLAELAADYLDCGLLSRARSAFEESQQLQLPDPRAVRYGEEILARLEDFDAACKLVKEHAQTYGGDPNGRIAMLRCDQGRFHWKQEAYDEALSAFKKATAADQTCIPAHLGVAQYWREQDKPDKALKYIAKQRAHFGETQWMYLEELKHIAMMQSDHEAFRSACEQQLERRPDDWRSRRIWAVFLMETGAYEAASEALLTAIGQAPQTLVLHQQIWRLMLRMPEPLDLLSSYQGLLKEDLVFREAYECKVCRYRSAQIQWRCPSCQTLESFTERQV